MTHYRHILVGLDLSEDSEPVLDKAASLASTCNAKLSLAHVIEPLAFAYGGDVPIDLSEAQGVMETQAKRRLKELCADHGPLTSLNVVIGQTAHELHQLAEELEADLIIVGSHGRHGLALIFGSTAGGVLKGASCDVLAVRV